MTAPYGWAALPAVFLITALGSVLVVNLQLRLMDVAGDAQTLGAMIKADRRYASALLVMVGALSDSADSARCAHAGYAAFLSKPVPQQTLIDTLKALRASLSIGMALPFMNFSSQAAASAAAALPGPAAAPLAGKCILAVDDNPVNLQVVSHMLERLGAQVDQAENGRVAVHMFLAKPYAAILMDCQMPELDGYQAVAEIRHLEGAMRAAQGAPGQQRVPVIALTAHALEGEREKCIDAGMDDFLTKPLRAAALREKLLCWLTPGGGPCDTPTEAEGQDKAVATDPVDAAQQLFGAKFAQLACLFMLDTPRRMTALDTAAAAGDAAQAAEIAHALAGCAGAVGALALSYECKLLESVCRAGRLDTFAERRDAIGAEHTLIHARLQQALPGHT